MTYPTWRMKFALSANDSGTWGLDPESDSGTRVVRSTEITLDGRVIPETAALRDLTMKEYRATRLNADDILVVKSSGSDAHLGKSGWVDERSAGMSFSNFIQRLRVAPNFNSRFTWYFMNSNAMKDQVRLLSSTSTGLQNLSGSLIREIKVPAPPLYEQGRITNFLDTETAQIDHLMNGQLRLLELLEERVNNRILEIIGQSAIVTEDGLPLIPLRRVLAKLERPTIPTEDVITAFRDGQVTARGIRRAEGYTMTANAEPQGQGVLEGDIVIHGLDGFAGAIGDSEAAGNCSPAYHVCLPKDGGDSAFYGRLLRLLALGDYLALFGASARERAVDFRNWKIFGHAPVPVVEPKIQHEIGGMITKIRPLREEVTRFNALLTERRQALISAAVTGRITV